MFWGRTAECGRLDALVAEVRSGRSSTLVLRGDPGVGKTALLDYLAERASECRVLRAGGVESEMELAFAGLHQLCAPMVERLEHLPGPQCDALRVAFGLSAIGPPDRFLVGLAVLGLLADAAEERPLVCLIDDVQWLDRASVQALAFAARRLFAEPVGLVFAMRESLDDLVGLPALLVEGLGDAAARRLLASVIRGRLDERVEDRIVAETRGNPLALLELPQGLTSTELAGGFGLAVAVPLAGRIEESYLRRLAPLPAESRRLLLVAAAEPVGAPVLVWRAAELLGVGADAAAPAVESGLVEFGARVRFRHPLVRSAVYGAASSSDRQQVHAALAEATNAELDPDRRAWHRAHATTGLDEAVADELERSAGRAQARGGLAAAAAFLERAASLTPEPARRGVRALAAAQLMHQAGAFDAALGLLAMVEAHAVDELQRARVDLLRAQIAFASSRGRDAPPLLLAAAKRLELLDVGLGRETFLEAFSAAMFAGRLASGGGVMEVAHAARAAPPTTRPPRAPDLLLDGLAARFTEGYVAGAPMMQSALVAFRREDLSPDDGIRWLWLACWIAAELWDDESWDVLSTRHVQLVRDAGALTVLPIVLNGCSLMHLLAGEMALALSLVEEVKAVTEATGSRIAPYGAMWCAAVQGRVAEASALVDATITEGVSRGEGFGLSGAEWASAVLYNGLGRYEDAMVAVRRSSERPGNVAGSTWALPELIEAAARSGAPAIAATAFGQLEARTRAAGTEWAQGVEALSRALISGPQDAEALYQAAIARLAGTRILLALARAHLLYGEWLHRENRRVDARLELRLAHDMFNQIGAEAFAERARRELTATGETMRERAVETVNELTAQEVEIARMARDGHTNPEIGARLFISPRTVEWHLHKVFAKLEVTSRKGLRQALPDSSSAGARA